MNGVVLGPFEWFRDEHFALDPRCNMYEIGEELEALNGDTSRTYFAFPALRANANDVSWIGGYSFEYKSPSNPRQNLAPH
jgi:hypothetical protein